MDSNERTQIDRKTRKKKSLRNSSNSGRVVLALQSKHNGREVTSEREWIDFFSVERRRWADPHSHAIYYSIDDDIARMYLAKIK